MGIISGLGSFRGQFGDHFRVGDHFGVGIISGAVQTPLLPPWKKEKKNGKLKHHILPFSGSDDHIRFHSSLIPAHFSIFRCHSGSFRYIPVPFLSIPFHSGVILPRSGIFRLIPVYSVPFSVEGTLHKLWFRSIPFLCLVRSSCMTPLNVLSV